MGPCPERVSGLYGDPSPLLSTSPESGCLRMQPKVGGKLHLRRNTGTRPIANKYREGKVKRTWKRECNSTGNRIEANGWDRVADSGDSALARRGAHFWGPSPAPVCASPGWPVCTFPEDGVTTGFRAAQAREQGSSDSGRRTYRLSVSGRLVDRGTPYPPPGGARVVRTASRLARTARSARRPRLAFWLRDPPPARPGSVTK